MAFPEISTGYKPEFGLGALYQGMNAANVNQSAELELIKQFLANQRETQMQPVDLDQAKQNVLAGMYKTDPRYQQGMTDMIEGQGYSNLAAGQTAQGLQQFKQEAGQAELQNQAVKERLFGNMMGGVETQMDQSRPEKERIAGLQQSQVLADALSEIDPKFIQQKKILGMKGDEALELESARAQRLATTKSAAIRGDKTAQEALVKELQRRVASGEITPDQYAAELAELQNAILAAKIQPGPTLNLDNPKMQGVFQPKPPQAAYTPPVSGQQTPQQLQPVSTKDFRSKYPQYEKIDDAKLKEALKAKGIDLQ